MRLPKDLVNRVTRKFRADLNKSAEDKLMHETFYHTEKYGTIHFVVEVKENSSDCFDPHLDTYATSWRKKPRRVRKL